MELFTEIDIFSFFDRYKDVEDVYKIVYSGKGVSLNDYYSAGHWSKRSKLKNTYKPIFEKLLEESNTRRMHKFSLLLRFNSRHDTDNITGLEKLFVDTVKGKYVVDDTKKYYRGYMVFPDESLPVNTFEFYLIAHAN
jgi:hypothetical protein